MITLTQETTMLLSFYLSAAIMSLPWTFKVWCALIKASVLHQALSPGLLNDKLRTLLILSLAQFVMKSVFILALFWPLMVLIAWRIGSFNPEYVGRKLINGD